MNDIAPKHKRGPRKEHVDFAAKFTSNGVQANLDLPPALNKMYCRKCGRLVEGRATCPDCDGEA